MQTNSRNLTPGQYQIGNFVFGEGTLFNVESFDDVGGYDVNIQDSQASSSDEMRFGSDSLKPQPIQMIVNARNNWLLPNIAALVKETRDLRFDHDKRVGQFIREWRSDEVRSKWGELKNLFVCRKDGAVLRVYGRPGKISVTRLEHNGESQKITAEFRRSDTVAYNDFEWFVNLQAQEATTLIRADEWGMGDASCWLRLLLVGPMIHPIIQVGSLRVELNASLDIGDVVEISSYPWERRCIRLNDGLSLNAQLVSPYLDKLSFPSNSPVQLSWTATGINSSIENVDFANFAPADWYPIDYSGPGGGTLDVSNGALRWSDSGNQWRLATRCSNVPTVTNYQLVGMTLAMPAESSLVEEECANRIIGRANESRSEYFYWDITYTKFWFGYHKDGGDYPLSQAFSISRCSDILRQILGSFLSSLFGISGAPVANWVYEAEFGTGAGELGTTLRINGNNVASFLADPEDFLPGNDHRYTGLGMRATARALGQSTPGPVTEFHFKDNPPEEIAKTLNVSAVLVAWRDAWQSI